MTPIAIDDSADTRVAAFFDPHGDHPNRVVAEGAVLVRRLCGAHGWRVRAMLGTEPALQAIADVIPAEVAVYATRREIIAEVAGYPFHRGVIALADRPAPRSIDAVLATHPQRVVVLERVTAPDNVGAIIRTARALGADAVVTSPGCADPWSPRALRASAGHAFVVPIAQVDTWPGALATMRQEGLRVLALSTAVTAVPIGSLPTDGPLAFLAGTEADGLSEGALRHVDTRVTIPMAPDGDSLNVAAAVAVALYATTRVP